MAMNRPKALSVFYFEDEGRGNLVEVVKVLKRLLRKRADLRTKKFVFFTAFGEGPALAYNHFQEFDVSIIAVTFPRSFTFKSSGKEVHPEIQPKVRAFFDGVGIKVLSGRLPFDSIEGADSLNRDAKLIKDVLTTICGSFPLCIQSVLQACDMGAIDPGEEVVGVTGDCAAVITASTTDTFLSRENGLVINEILCKPRNLNLARRRKRELSALTLFNGEASVTPEKNQMHSGKLPELTQGPEEEN